MKKLPTLKQAEKAIGEPAATWVARCFEIASRLVDAKLVDGVAVYGHWRGPVAKGSAFDRRANLGFVQHGWVVMPDGRVLDPTRWVFEGTKPYLYVGRADHYDEGGNEFREAVNPHPPEYDECEDQIELTQKILPSADAWNFVEKILGFKDWEPGTITVDQLRWLANRSPKTLGKHAVDIYKAVLALKLVGLIPIDNLRMVERTYKMKFK